VNRRPRAVRLRAGAHTFEVEAVLLDKDGTLVDLDAYWGPAARRWIEVASRGDPRLARALGERLGFDLERGAVIREGPFAGMTLAALAELTADALRALGVPVAEALARARAARAAGARTARDAPLLPVGDVEGALTELRRAGLAIGVVTSDDRRAAERALRAIGAAGLVDLVVAGDEGLPPKPDPALVASAAGRLGTVPARTLVVGDTELDRRMAVGTAGFVAVVPSGRPFAGADAAIRSIDELVVEAP
jgi:phosphoglycolate phosphatase